MRWFSLQFERHDSPQIAVGLDVYNFRFEGSAAERWDHFYLKAPFDLQWHKEFATRHGKAMSYPGWLHAFNTARRTAAVRQNLIPHDCRRTAIDRMERLGIARSTAMVMVGHKTESVYRRYAITSGKTIEDAGAKLAAVQLPK